MAESRLPMSAFPFDGQPALGAFGSEVEVVTTLDVHRQPLLKTELLTGLADSLGAAHLHHVHTRQLRAHVLDALPVHCQHDALVRVDVVEVLAQYRLEHYHLIGLPHADLIQLVHLPVGVDVVVTLVSGDDRLCAPSSMVISTLHSITFIRTTDVELLGY